MNNSSAWDQPAAPHSLATSSPRKLPPFIRTVAIIDLVMASLRLMIVPFSVIGFFVITDDDPLKLWAIPEILIGLAIGVIAITADIGMLMKKHWAVPASFTNLVITLIGILFGLAQLPATIDSSTASADPAMKYAMVVGAIGGALVAVTVRGTLWVLLLIATKRYAAWIDSKSQ